MSNFISLPFGPLLFSTVSQGAWLKGYYKEREGNNYLSIFFTIKILLQFKDEYVHTTLSVLFKRIPKSISVALKLFL